MWHSGWVARGWESKSVESQIELAEERNACRHVAPIDGGTIARQRERASIELSRNRVLADLEKALNPRYREMLERSLSFLDEKLAKLPADR